MRHCHNSSTKGARPLGTPIAVLHGLTPTRLFLYPETGGRARGRSVEVILTAQPDPARAEIVGATNR